MIERNLGTVGDCQGVSSESRESDQPTGRSGGYDEQTLGLRLASGEEKTRPGRGKR
jgi:hypothetical protein